MISKDFQEILRAFNAHRVKYMVVGGFAFGVHLEPRTPSAYTWNPVPRKTSTSGFALILRTQRLSFKR